VRLALRTSSKHGSPRRRKPKRLGALLIVLVTRSAGADHCHSPRPLDAMGIGLHVSTSAEVASYETEQASGDYQGISLGVAYETTWLRLRTLLPAYRLTRNGEHLYGLGDLATEVRVPVLREAEHGLAAGPSLLVTVPTGSATKDLGMGHFMLIGGLWGELAGERAFVQAQLGYARQLGAAEHDPHAAHHHLAGGPHPIVNPMNASEIAGSTAAGYRVYDIVWFRGGVDGAIPVATDGGESRAIAIVGVDLLFNRFDLGLEGQLPFVGDPFDAKALATAGVRF